MAAAADVSAPSRRQTGSFAVALSRAPAKRSPQSSPQSVRRR